MLSSRNLLNKYLFHRLLGHNSSEKMSHTKLLVIGLHSCCLSIETNMHYVVVLYIILFLKTRFLLLETLRLFMSKMLNTKIFLTQNQNILVSQETKYLLHD